MKKYWLFFLLVAFSSMVWASVEYQRTLSTPQLNERGEYSSISLEGALVVGQPGEPSLPRVGIRLLLPEGMVAKDVRVLRENPTVIPLSRLLEPLQPQIPISLEEIPPPTLPDQAIYAQDASFPLEYHSGANTQYLAGHPIFFGTVCPFEYNPVKGELVFYRNLRISVETVSDPLPPVSRGLLKKERQITTKLLASVDNPAAVPRYAQPSSGYEYLIIYDSAKYEQWLPLKTIYDSRGYNVLMKPAQQIYAENSGATNQDKIRNYIISLYATNSLRYVFLAGDVNVIPVKLLRATSGSYVANIPADIFYTSLDGNWNADGDTYWGEMGEADLVPELAIGRYSYNTDAEIASFIAKLTYYLDTPEAEEVRSALYLGEQLDAEPTWGGDSMDELLVGSSANGYTTTGIPSDWNNAFLYDKIAVWGLAQLKARMNEGFNLINHLGHGSYTSCFGISNTDVTTANFTNDGSGENFSLIFTQACYAGGFDYEDSIAEKFMSLPTATVAMIANSRYGWYARSSTNGSSQHFNREYIDAYFGEGISAVGDAVNDCKIDLIPFTISSDVFHWCHYEINLLGDPAMLAWTDTPQTITATLPEAWISGLDHYNIPTNAPGAGVRIKNGSEFLYEGFADSAGLAYIHLERIIAPGTYDLYIECPNFYIWHSQITFVASAEPYLTCLPIVFADSDGLFETGEVTEISATLRNTGLVGQITAGTLHLTSSSPYIHVLGGTYAFAPLAAGDSLVIDDVFSIQIQGTFTDLSAAQLLFTAEYDGLSSESHAWLELNASKLSVVDYQPQNPTWHLQPGDNPSWTLTVNNTGSGHAYTPLLQLSCSDPNALLSTEETILPALLPNSVTEVTSAFSLSISALAPLNTPILIDYTLMAESGVLDAGQFRVYVSETGYHFENSLMGFSSVDLGTGYVNQWHRSEQRNHSLNGAHAMKFGGVGPAFYASRSYGSLESPLFQLQPGTQLKFWHWLESELDAETTEQEPVYAWDGAYLEISIDNGQWFQIAPIGGYPCLMQDNPYCAIPANTPVWSGTIAWSEVVFDLSAYSGNAKFRFVFGSDGSVAGEGWYLDDLTLEYGALPTPKAPENVTCVMAETNLLISWNAVTQDTEEQPLTPDNYDIYRCSEPDGAFEYLGSTSGLSYPVEPTSLRWFYRVIAVGE